MNSIQQLLITVNIIFIINSVFGTYKIHQCLNNKINTINENLENKKKIQSIIPDIDHEIHDNQNENDDTDATCSNKECKYSKMLFIISSGIRSTMYKYNYTETVVKFYDSNCQFQKVTQTKGNNPMILEAYALANMAYFRVLYEMVNDYLTSFKNPIIITEPIAGPYGINTIFTEDMKFIINFLNKREFDDYTSMLLVMFYHFCEHPKSFLQKIFGFYRIKYNSDNYYFTIIFNIYPLTINETFIKRYDLSGSGTSVNENEGEQTSDLINYKFENDWPGGITIPDLNIYDSIIHDLECDFNRLELLNKIDYSLFMVVIKYQHYIDDLNKCKQVWTLLEYIRMLNNSTKGQSHYKNAIKAKTENDSLLIFMGIIDVSLKSTHNASCKLEDYKKQLMTFIIGKVFKKGTTMIDG